MELTFKIILDRRYQRNNETFALKLRVYQDRDYRECSLNININENDWDQHLQLVKSWNANHKIYNSNISTINAKVRKLILLNEDEEVCITPDEIIHQIKKIDKKKVKATKPDIFKFGKEHMANLENILE